MALTKEQRRAEHRVKMADRQIDRARRVSDLQVIPHDPTSRTSSHGWPVLRVSRAYPLPGRVLGAQEAARRLARMGAARG